MAESNMGSIFAALRASRSGNESTSINESENDELGIVTLNEGSDDTFTVIRCEDCGQIVSSVNECADGCPACGSTELYEKTVKVVRDGKVQTKNVSTKKRKLTPAQKAALAKARKKAHTAGANKARAKSMKVRNAKGMSEATTIKCPKCGYKGDQDEFVGNGEWECPECGYVWDSEE